MTRLLYLSDTYQFQAQAVVQEVAALEDGRTALILDQTIFYPQGGGQPCDTGIVSTKDARFVVTDVRMAPDGIVHHIGSWEQGTIAPGAPVELAIDKERRIKNAKLHSAGHLIDCAVTELELALKPGKGYHFSQGPYVEYEGEIGDVATLMPALQEKIDELVRHPIAIHAQDLSAEAAREQGIMVPAGKMARLVSFEGFAPCGCGGTHVRNAQEIGRIIIRKIKAKAGVVRISYDVA